MPFLNIGGQRLFYKQHDPEQTSGVTLLFVHGLGSSHSFYASVIPSCLKRGYSCIAFDTPGSGLSLPLASYDLTPPQIAELLAASISTLGLPPESIVAVGHSMGAMFVCELALQIPIRGVVLLGPVHPTPSLTKIFANRIINVRENGLELLADTIPAAATGSKAKPIHQAFIRTLILSQTPEGYISLCRTISEATQTRYDELHCRLLIIAGEDDKTSPLTGCKSIFDSWGCSLTEKRMVVLAGVGHWHCIEAPDDVSCSILEFVGNLG